MYRQNKNSHIRGLWSEVIVSIYLQSTGWNLIGHRKKIGTTEIDLIFKTPKDQMVLIEIKTSSFYHLSSFRWGESQKRKFFGVLSHLTTKYPYTEIYGVIAMVDYNKINFYYMDET